MFITRIRVHDLEDAQLFQSVLREIPELCASFVCYPSEKMFIAQSAINSAMDIIDLLRMRGINTENVIAKML